MYRGVSSSGLFHTIDQIILTWDFFRTFTETKLAPSLYAYAFMLLFSQFSGKLSRILTASVV